MTKTEKNHEKGSGRFDEMLHRVRSSNVFSLLLVAVGQRLHHARTAEVRRE